MQTKIQKLPKSLVEIEFELSEEEMQPYLPQAAKELSKEIKIDGFRPGNVPLDVLKQKVGEMALYERAADIAVRKSYTETVKKENLQVIGQPQIEVLKLAPKNPFSFKARAALMPKIKLADWRKLKIEKKEIKIEENEVEKILHDLQKMQTKEKLVKRPIGRHDKVVLDVEILLDKVLIEGGQAKDHSIYLDEPYYIPGFCDQLIGLSAGQTKEFSLPFPKEHYQKNLAGKDADFKINIKEVFELEYPALDDNLAKGLGQNSLSDLKNLIRQNLQAELSQKEEQREEIEILEKIIEGSRFDDIPEILVNTEAHKMLHELEDGVAEKGLEFNKYLESIGKTLDQMLLDFAPQAVKRVKSAIAVSEIANKENIKVSEGEIDKEIEKMLEIYKDEPELYEKIKSEESRQYLRNVLSNRKVIKLLKEKMVEK
jgi:trigger factor